MIISKSPEEDRLEHQGWLQLLPECPKQVPHISFFFFLILIDLAAPGLSCSGQDLQSMEPVIKVTDLEFCTKATEAEPCTQVILEMTDPIATFAMSPLTAYLI